MHIYIALQNHQYFPIFYLMLTSVKKNTPIKRLLCEVVVAASCLLSSDKKELNTAWRGHGFVDEFISVCFNTMKCSNAITYIDADLFPP